MRGRGLPGGDAPRRSQREPASQLSGETGGSGGRAGDPNASPPWASTSHLARPTRRRRRQLGAFGTAVAKASGGTPGSPQESGGKRGAAKVLGRGGVRRARHAARTPADPRSSSDKTVAAAEEGAAPNGQMGPRERPAQRRGRPAIPARPSESRRACSCAHAPARPTGSSG